ncbi:MAG: ABC transporter permease [Dongiaceae bacterium]
MIDILTDPTQLADFLATSLRLSVPIIFAALGGVLSERSGVFNIGLEGMLLAGCFGAAVGAYFFGTPFAGVAVGMFFGLLGALILAYLSITLGVSQIVSGIAINMLMLGLTAFLSRIVFEGQANTMTLSGFKPIAIPLLSQIPVLGPVFFNQDLLVYVMYAMVAGGLWLMYRTRWGLNVRAVGENPRAVDTAGISVVGLRYACVLTSGAIAGLGGCYLVLSQIFLFSEHMSAGKGFIALAAVILGRWNPLGALLACLLFGVFDALQLRLQFANPEVPYQAFVILPYAVSILALVGLVGKPTPPAAVGIPYKREAK